MKAERAGGIRGREGGVMAAKSMKPVEEVRSEAPRSRTIREWLGGAIKVTLLSGGLLGGLWLLQMISKN